MSTQQPALSNHRLKPASFWPLVVLGTLLLCLGISGASLWIDEAFSAYVAAEPTLHAWAYTLGWMKGSDSQMPGYYLYLWTWARVFGLSEWAMRLANVPWALLFAAALAWGSARLLKIRYGWLILCLSPFAWFYMNEARPYALILGLSMAALVAVLAYIRDSERYRLAPYWAVAAVWLLWCTHMLTIALVPSLIVLLWILRPASVNKLYRDWRWPVLVGLPFYLGMAFYYVETLRRHRGGIRSTPGLGNMAFAVYELLGFGGLGPPRELLRNSPGLHLLVPYLPTMALGAVAFLLIAVALGFQLRQGEERRTIAALLVAFIVGLLLIFGLAYAAHFNVLGRHVAFIFALFDFLLLLALFPANQPRHRKLQLSAVLMLGVAWSVSDFRQRLLPSYQKEDYRDAATLARNALAHGVAVLWIADVPTGQYYGVPMNHILDSAGTFAPRAGEAASGTCAPPRFDTLLHADKQVMVVLTDRKEYDPSGDCRRILAAANPKYVARLNAFDVWLVGSN